MRAVLDTNVYVSAFINPPSPPERVVDALAAGHFDPVLSDAILAELAGVLARPRIVRYLRRSPRWIAAFLSTLQRFATVVEPTPVVVILQDPPDDLILGTALAGAADYLVSGNKHLLDLGSFQGIPILTPAQFLAVLETERRQEDR